MKVRKSVVFILTLLVLVGCLTVFASAQTMYISELAVVSGENAMSELEQSGYTIMFQRMNLINDDEEAVPYLAYRKGSDAITDIIVSDSGASEITVGEITYYLVSGISLNRGNYGPAIYLYYTRDSRAGCGITSLTTVSGFSSDGEIIPLLNDGSSPVRTQDGALANLDEGIYDCELYLIKNSSEDVRPFISKAQLVSGYSKSAAIYEAVNSGCDYYLDCDLGVGGYSIIAYQRTADKADAITDVKFEDSELKTEKNPDSTKFLIDISDSMLFEEEFTLGDWAFFFSYTSKAISKDAYGYRQLADSPEECCCVPVGEGSSLFAMYLGKLDDELIDPEDEDKEKDKEELEEPGGEEPENTPEENIEDTAPDEEASEAMDDFYDIDKEEAEDVLSEDEIDDSSAASVLGEGNVLSVVILAAILIAAFTAATIILKGRKRNGKNN